MQKKWIKPVVAIAAVPVIAIGAFQMVKAYEAGTAFQPNGNNRELQVNQVVFSGEEDTTAQKNNEEKEGESELWEKDKTAEDSLSPELKNSADYLFQTGRTNLPDGAQNINLAGEEANNSLLPGDGTNGNGNNGYIYDVTGDRDNADLVIGTGAENGGISGTGTGTGTGSGSGQGGTTPAVTPKPSDPSQTPAPQPTTRPADTVKDPEPEKQKDSLFGDSKPFDPDKVDNKPENWVYIGNPFSTSDYKLYRGQVLSEKSVFAALSAWVIVDGVQYDWTMDDVGKYVKIDKISFDDGVTWIEREDFSQHSIPMDASTMLIKASYRFSTKDEWTDYVTAWEDYISYLLETGRIYVLDHVLNQSETVISTDSILNDASDQYVYEGSCLNLYKVQDRYFKKLYGIASTEKWPEDKWLDKIFTGWTENGEPVDWSYVSTSGRHILEPGEVVPLRGEYGVQLQRFQVDYADCYLQTLKTWHGFFYHHVKELEIPEGIQAIDMVDSTVVDNLVIPESVLMVNTDSFQVNNAYRVSVDNQQYTSSGDGLLLNKEETQILDVPTGMKVLVVPDTIQDVQMSVYNNVEKIVIQTEDENAIPEIDVTNLKNCEISIADELVEAFYEKNDLEYEPEQNNRVTAGGKTYYLRDQLLYNGEGELRKVLSEGRKSISLTDEIKSIDKDAFQGQEDLTTLILSQTNDDVKLKDGCFQDSGIKVIQCYSEKQMENIRKQLRDGDGITVKALLQAGTSGYWYTVEELNGDRRITLVKAPEDLIVFDGKIKDKDGKELNISEIGENAFSKCKSLKWVTLPESVDTIGYEAFYGCSSLQGILIDTKDTITIGDQSMEGCPELRFAASNAMQAVCVDEYDPEILGKDSGYDPFFYKLNGAEGYGYNARTIVYSDDITYYTLKDLDTEGIDKILYGASPTYGEWLAIRSGSELPEEVKLPESTQEIYNYAMADTHAKENEGNYTVNWKELTNLHGILKGAFVNSGLAGEISIVNDTYRIQEYAFWGCEGITEVQLQGKAQQMGTQAFQYCKNLKKISFGSFDDYVTLQALIFSGCENLQEISLSDDSAKLTLMESHPFYFDSEEKDLSTRLMVPDNLKDYYLKKWRYFFTGYVSDNSSITDYQVLYNAVQKEMKNFDGEVSDAEVEAEVNRRLLAAENRLRTMLGMNTVDVPTDFDSYETESAKETDIILNVSDNSETTVSDGNALPSVSGGDAVPANDGNTEPDNTQEETVQ